MCAVCRLPPHRLTAKELTALLVELLPSSSFPAGVLQVVVGYCSPQLLLTENATGDIQLYELYSGKRLHTFMVGETAAEFRPGSEKLWVVAPEKNWLLSVSQGVLQVYDASTWQCVQSWREWEYFGAGCSMCWVPAHQWLAVARAGALDVLDVGARKLVRHIHVSWAAAVVPLAAPDGARLMAYNRRADSLLAWSLPSFECQLQLLHMKQTPMLFGPDLLVAGDAGWKLPAASTSASASASAAAAGASADETAREWSYSFMPEFRQFCNYQGSVWLQSAYTTLFIRFHELCLWNALRCDESNHPLPIPVLRPDGTRLLSSKWEQVLRVDERHVLLIERSIPLATAYVVQLSASANGTPKAAAASASASASASPSSVSPAPSTNSCSTEAAAALPHDSTLVLPLVGHIRRQFRLNVAPKTQVAVLPPLLD